MALGQYDFYYSFIYLIRGLSYDRSIASYKATFPQCVI